MNAFESATAGKPLLSRADAAALCGVERQTLDRAIRRGALRVVKIGRRVLIPSEALRDFVFGDKGGGK